MRKAFVLEKKKPKKSPLSNAPRENGIPYLAGRHWVQVSTGNCLPPPHTQLPDISGGAALILTAISTAHDAHQPPVMS